MTALIPDVRELVPHSGRMVLLDRIDACTADSLTASVTIREGAMFVAEGRVPAWVALEYLAQAISAWAGFQARIAGGKPKLGFLLGSRLFTSAVPYFTVGTTLRLEVRHEFESDEGLASFACSVHTDVPVIETMMTVFQPEHPEQFLRQEQS